MNMLRELCSLLEGEAPELLLVDCLAVGLRDSLEDFPPVCIGFVVLLFAFVDEVATVEVVSWRLTCGFPDCPFSFVPIDTSEAAMVELVSVVLCR